MTSPQTRARQPRSDSPELHLEARLEAGLFPFFEAIPIFSKGGIQVGTAI